MFSTDPPTIGLTTYTHQQQGNIFLSIFQPWLVEFVVESVDRRTDYTYIIWLRLLVKSVFLFENPIAYKCVLLSLCFSLTSKSAFHDAFISHQRDPISHDKHIYTLIVNKQLEQSKEPKFQKERAGSFPDLHCASHLIL